MRKTIFLKTFFVFAVMLLIFGNINAVLAADFTKYSSKDNPSSVPLPGTAGTEYVASVVADIDGDNTDDFVVMKRHTAPAIVWYKKDGNNNKWIQKIIEPGVLNIGVYDTSLDVDSDGDLDIINLGDYNESLGHWWENPGPSDVSAASSWTKHLIKNSATGILPTWHDYVSGDFDGDGAKEMAVWGRGSGVSKLYLYEIPSDVKTRTAAWPTPSTIYTRSSGGECEGMAVADIDLDGKVDIIGCNSWFKRNNDGTYTRNIIDSAEPQSAVTGKSTVGQLAKGGRPEILFSGGDFTGFAAWYEWTGTAWTKHSLLNVDHAHSLEVGDLDGDNDEDIFVAEMSRWGSTFKNNARMMIYKNDGAASPVFSLTTLATGLNNHESALGDFNGDGRLDILQKSYGDTNVMADNEIAVWLQSNTISVTNWTYKLIDNSRVRYDTRSSGWFTWFGLGFTDVNNDGFKEIISGKYYYKNPGGDMLNGGNFWTSVTFPVNVDASLATDADGDANADVIGFGYTEALTPSAGVYWLEKTGAGDTTADWTAKLVVPVGGVVQATPHSQSQGFRMAQIVPGGKEEIVTSAGSLGQLFYIKIPSDPNTTPWTVTVISNSFNNQGLAVGDINKDGFVDVAGVKDSSDHKNTSIFWWENPGATESANWTAHSIGSATAITTGGSDGPDRVELADLNGDGRLDIILTDEVWRSPTPTREESRTYWFEQPTNPTSAWGTSKLIVKQQSTNSLDVADMDGDGDIDVVTGEHKGDKELTIWQNNGAGVFTENVISTLRENHNGAQLADLDGDGDLDIVSITWDDNYATTGGLLHMWRNDNAIGPIVPGNQPPAVSITAPYNGQKFEPNSNITLTATASDTDGTVTKVEFFKGNTSLGIGIVSASTYTFSWLNVPAGNYILKAVATDDDGATGTSSTVNILVGSSATTSGQEVYREYIKIISSGNDWRVTDPNAPYNNPDDPGNNPSAFLPNPKISLGTIDVEGASRAEAILSIWGGHPGSTPKKLRFNEKSWLTVPELSTTPTSGECYLSEWNPKVEVPLTDLISGVNSFEGTSGPQSCFNFGWGQWGWYSLMLRVYTCEDHVEGAIDSYQKGDTLPENPTISIALFDPNSVGVDRVEYFAYFDGYDTDGDGVFQDYQVSYQRPGPTLSPSQHVGTGVAPSYSVTWDTSWVPDQYPGSIKLMARILGSNGVWYVTPEVTGLSLDRPSTSVQLYKPENVPADFGVRTGASMKSEFTVPDSAPFANIVEAKLLVRTWNGAAPTSSTRINSRLVASYYGKSHYYSYDQLNVPDPETTLLHGKNNVWFHSDTEHHALEVLWPGPGVLVKYNVKIDMPVAGNPVFNPGAGEYTSTQLVTITSTSGATIHYTIDGSEPTESSQVYTGPVSVATTRTIKAKAWIIGGMPSATASATYTINRPVSVVWWDANRHFRLSIVTEAAGYERKEKPVETNVNFTEILNALGENGSFDPNSIRVIETDESGTLISDSVPFQFDKDASYNAATSAKGTIIFIASGAMPANGVRYYKVYFDVVGQSFTLPAIAPQTTLTGDTSIINDEGMAIYKITTPNSIYFYQKNAGGFSSLHDAGGNDWIGYHPGGGSGGEYRGIPNAGYPGYLHPGFDCCTSDVITKGPLKVSIHTKSKSTKPQEWETVWDFYPEYARMTMLKIAHPYWVLYEGTPGGTLESSDYVVRNNGTADGIKTRISDKWTEDLKSDEWVYFTDFRGLSNPALSRSLFLANNQDDNSQDLYWRMGTMTVFGFGRSDAPLGGLMSSLPHQFTVGLINGLDRPANSKAIYSAYKDLVITKAVAEKFGSSSIFVPPVPPPPTPPPTITPTPVPSSVCLFNACGGECNDYNVCTDDSCDQNTGKCLFVYNTAPCDDNNLCTPSSTCSGGLCRGIPKSCADTDECTYDSCDPDTGLCSNPNVCGGLVPCGRLVDNPATTQINETAPCDLCSLFYMIKSVINYAAQISFGLALLMFTIAGLLYATSAGDNRKATLAKNTIRYALIGLLFIFLAWLAIAVVLQALGYGNAGTWNQVNCVLR